MKALVFPGQGSQYKGMAKDICERYPECQELVEKANQIVGYSISDIMFDGSEEALRQTRYTQLAIFLHSMMAAHFLDESDVVMTAGHSLGEYSALCFSKSIAFEDAVRIVAKRGELMQKAGETNPGSMAAIIGLDEKVLEDVLSEANTFGTVQAANFNSPGQVVISGEVEAIKKAVEIAKAKGSKLAKELVVSGAFHSALMKPAEKELAEALANIEIKRAEIPVCMNTVAKPVTDADEIRENLIHQLTSPVLWQQSIMHMVAGGVREFLEVGPQKVLQGLIKRIDRSAKLSGVDTAEDMANLLTVSSS
ncbi:malonyl CoA-acyl carrier protein transacylase [Chloroherpeton thalassium ATCC 35110]|uniref:Malonyl CoA-acyl carrier protein transacylase n=1 Tax=Chloroherpeton thalassium (strain ATCC 35110 / GB-78) TaxID=517418 RepID=B3QVT7_CHLT3|nr:ACP S-malonyltransferase [Chloroherpeton thalassium]ACF13144.1 malonyl CoA-acyl carrier protein transacylase [Chloroherpeton thalassium ATCC 35110]